MARNACPRATAGQQWRSLTKEGVGDIQQDASDITLDLRIEAHLALGSRLLFGGLQHTRMGT